MFPHTCLFSFSSCQLILEEQILQNPQQVEGENIELQNLQVREKHKKKQEG